MIPVISNQTDLVVKRECTPISSRLPVDQISVLTQIPLDKTILSADSDKIHIRYQCQTDMI